MDTVNNEYVYNRVHDFVLFQSLLYGEGSGLCRGEEG